MMFSSFIVAAMALASFANVEAHDERLRGANIASQISDVSVSDAAPLGTDRGVKKADYKNTKVEDGALSDVALTDDEPTGNGTEAADLEWLPGDEADPLSEEELEKIMAHLPRNSVLKDMSTKPGKGLGRNNLKALVNSGKPFLLNGLDDDLRADLAEEMKFKLDNKNQPYLIVIPEREKGNQMNFHFIEATAPLYNDLLDGGTFDEKRRNFLLEFLKLADVSDNDVKEKNSSEENGDRRRLAGYAKPTRTYYHTAGPYYWYNSAGEYLAQYWETAYFDYYKTSRGHDIHVTHHGNWNSHYKWDDRNNKRGFANGHSTHKITPPSGYSIRDYTPKNINNVYTVTEETGFELSGSAECGAECTAGVGATYSEKQTISYKISEWEILANGYGQWDFKQAKPFKVYSSPMYTDFACYWEGGCLHYPPALSRGTLNYKTAVLLTGGTTGWKWIAMKNTGRTFVYQDRGWFSWGYTYWTMWLNSGRWVYVG